MKIGGRSGFGGGGGKGGVRSFSQGFDPQPTQRVPPLYFFEISIFLTDLKVFLKAPLPLFEGGARRKNAIFWLKISKKCLKTPF